MAVGDRTEKRMIGPVALTTSNAAVGTTPGTGKNWVIKQITICNTAGIDALVYLAIGSADTPGNRFMSALPIGLSDSVVYDTGIVLGPSDQIFGYADRTGLTVMFNGWEKEV
jgi:hypothetical protein